MDQVRSYSGVKRGSSRVNWGLEMLINHLGKINFIIMCEHQGRYQRCANWTLDLKTNVLNEHHVDELINASATITGKFFVESNWFSNWRWLNSAIFCGQSKSSVNLKPHLSNKSNSKLYLSTWWKNCSLVRSASGHWTSCYIRRSSFWRWRKFQIKTSSNIIVLHPLKYKPLFWLSIDAICFF